jgi:nitrate reductase NapAB chaperone NapD
MLVAGLVVETRPDRVAQVAERLAALSGIEVHGSNEHGVAISWCGENQEELDRLSEQIVTGDPDIISIYPTYVGDGADDPKG